MHFAARDAPRTMNPTGLIDERFWERKEAALSFPAGCGLVFAFGLPRDGAVLPD